MNALPRRLIVALVLALAPGSLAAQRSWYIEEFHSDLEVQPTGVTRVTETIRFRFNGSWNGIYRDLRLTPPDVYGRRDLLDVELVSITDGSGQPLRFETSSQGSRVRRWQVWVPGAEDAARTVVIRYDVQDGIGFFGQPGGDNYLDEIYWNVTGTEWEVRIEHASARVVLPPGAQPVQSAAYTGSKDVESQTADIRTSGNTVTFDESRVLGPGENLTVATSWPGGLVARTEQPGAVTHGAAAGWPLVLPLFAFFLSWKQWDRKGRDPEPRAIVVRYEPPDSLTPAEVGTLVDHNAEMHDITATLVDLAVRGYLHIEKEEKKVFGLFKNNDYIFHLKRPREEWGGLNPHEVEYLDALFKHGGSVRRGFMAAVFGKEEPDLAAEGAGEGPTYDSVRLSDLKEKFYKDLPGIKKAIYSQLITKGHYRTDPTKVRAAWSIGALVLIGASVFAGVWAYNNALSFVDPVVLGIAGGVAGVIVFVFGQLMPARTERGARARENALGFKEFLSKVEEDRYRRMIKSPEQFEQYLPFAMAFEVEDRWAKAFEDMFREPPQWCSGYAHGHFHASSFTSDMRSMSTAAASTMSSSPSGSSGGGSSGGGGGGGGGGAF